MALALEKANASMAREMVQLKIENARLRGEDIAHLELELRIKDEQLAARHQMLFGASSEKRASHREAAADAPGASSPGHGPTAQPALPLVEVVHELDEPDRTCPACGGRLEAMVGQFEESEEVDVLERSFRIVLHRRQKYRCRCGGCVETAPGPPKLIPGGRYAIPFAVDVAVAKYGDHLPLARQVQQMAREGLQVRTQTLWDQLVGLELHLEPSYDALQRYVLEAPVVGADETRWRVTRKGAGAKTYWVWALCRDDAVVYRILSSRSTSAARDLLGDYAGVVVCDGYAAYASLEKGSGETRAGPRIVLAHCWAHVRRKFLEAERHYPEANEVLTRIAALYDIEREIREAEVSDRATHTHARRRADSAPLVAEIRDWLAQTHALPRSSLGKAISYTAGIWPGLCRFVEDPAIPIDNNGVERGMRAVALGRKNHLGSRSLHGTHVSALFYSLIESAKLAGIEPRAYLLEATRRAIAEPGTVTLPRDLLR